MGVFVEKEPVEGEGRYYVVHNTRGKGGRNLDVLYIDEDQKVVVLSNWAEDQGWRVLGPPLDREIEDAPYHPGEIEDHETVPPPPGPSTSEDDIARAVLRVVGSAEHTRYADLAHTLNVPRADLARIVNSMIQDGRLADYRAHNVRYLMVT